MFLALPLAKPWAPNAAGRAGLPLDLGAQSLEGIAPRRRLDGLAIFAHARGAVGPELGHVRAVDDVEERAGTDAHLDERAEGEVDQIDHGVGLIDDVLRLNELVDLFAHPGNADVRARRLQQFRPVGDGVAETAVELRDLVKWIVKTHQGAS